MTNGNESLYKLVGDHWNVIPEDYYSNTIFHVLPDNSREIINADENNHLLTDILNYPGQHSIQTDGVNIGQVAVNIDETELNCNYITIEELQNKATENIQIIPIESDIKETKTIFVKILLANP